MVLGTGQAGFIDIGIFFLRKRHSTGAGGARNPNRVA